jgi:peptide-methionine (R)-S-oxide reductase
MKLTEQQWQDKLSPEAFRVCRQKGTERPYTGAYLHHNEQGDYVCHCCGAVLFSYKDKFDSGCGWPSFSAQHQSDNVRYQPDNSYGMQRTEIICKQCDSHLGHVFDDGPAPSGQRYCVNSVSLDFSSKSD